MKSFALVVFRCSIVVVAVGMIFTGGIFANRMWTCSCGAPGFHSPLLSPDPIEGPFTVTTRTPCPHCIGKGCDKCDGGWIYEQKTIDPKRPPGDTEEPPLADPKAKKP